MSTNDIRHLERVEQNLLSRTQPTGESDPITLSCDHCGQEYTLDNARTIAIFGPDDVRYTCHRCGHGTNGPSPIDSEE